MCEQTENEFELSKQERLQNFFTGLETDETTISDIPRHEREIFRIELNNRLRIWPEWLDSDSVAMLSKVNSIEHLKDEDTKNKFGG